MAFTGKATYGTAIPAGAEDVSEVVALVSPFETPFLDALGDADTEAESTTHSWTEMPLAECPVDSEYREETGSVPTDCAADDPACGNTGGQTYKTNYTQVFTESVKIGGALDALSLIGVDREFDYQTVNRLRELLRSLERSVIAGLPPASDPPGGALGGALVRRSMRGLIPSITAGITDADNGPLDEAMLNMALRTVWENGGTPNVLLVNGYQKRKISQFIQPARRYDGEEQAFRNVVGVYESAFGVQRVLLSRWVPPDSVLLLDTNKIKVLPLRGRSFHLKPLAESGEHRWAQVIGEYTLEVRNAADGGHGRIKNLFFA